MIYNIDDELVEVDIYSKFNIIDSKAGKKVVVISFHERNNPI
jgi:hypothetical protein